VTPYVKESIMKVHITWAQLAILGGLAYGLATKKIQVNISKA